MMIWSCLATPTSAAADAECPAVAVLDGDAELVSSIAAELATRGIDTVLVDGCPAVRVRVRRAGTGLLLRIEDGYGRRSERRVADVPAAATLIESWARSDVNDGLLAGWSYEPPAAAESVPVASDPPAVSVAVEAPHERNRSLVTIGVVGETAVAFDGSLWGSAGATACVRWRRFCAGGTFRVLRGAGEGTRRGGDVRGSVELPFGVGKAVMLPGITLGAGWISITETVGMNTQENSNTGMRAGIHTSLSYPLAYGLWAQVGLSADVALFTVAAQNQDMNGVPGEPRGYVRASVGLRLGTP